MNTHSFYNLDRLMQHPHNLKIIDRNEIRRNREVRRETRSSNLSLALKGSCQGLA